MRKRILITAFSLAVAVGLGALTVATNPTVVPRVAAALSGQAITDFNVIVGPGSLNRMFSFSSTGIFRENGTVITNGLATVTVTRPDASVVNFRQRTDTDGRMRGFVFAPAINQVGTYQIQVDPDDGGVASTSFTITDPADAANLTTGTLETDRLSDTFLASIGGNDSGTTHRAKSIIDTEESTSSETFTTLATPDQVTVTLPTDGLLTIDYRALPKVDDNDLSPGVSQFACASIFVDGNQLTSPDIGGPPQTHDGCRYISPETETPAYGYLYFAPNGEARGDATDTTDSTDVTTGETIGIDSDRAATLRVFAAAGTHTVSVRYRLETPVTIPGTVFYLKNRKLWVKAEGY